MALWRAAAIERLPELRQDIASALNVMSLWIELQLHFTVAYGEPRNESLIARIYSYADWCIDAPRNDDAGRDPFSAMIVAFYEHIPKIPEARADMPRWFQFEEVNDNKTVFGYHLDDDEFKSLLAHMQRNKSRYVPRKSML